jgi:hypothetical protein
MGGSDQFDLNEWSEDFETGRKRANKLGKELEANAIHLAEDLDTSTNAINLLDTSS